MSFFGKILGLSSSSEEVVGRVCVEENDEDRIEEKGEPDEDISEPSEEEEEEESEEPIHFLNQLLFKNDYVEFYKTDAQSFVNNIKIWAGQRDLNKEHIVYLAQQITKEKHIMGTFTLVRADDGTVVLVNGHHRVRALKKILKLQPRFNCDIIIELYKTDRLESKRTLTLFKNSNTILNVKVEDMPNKYALSLIDKLKNHFGDSIFKLKHIEEICNRPYIHETLFFSKLKKAFQEQDLDADSLFNEILKYNDKLKKNKYPIENKLKTKGKCVETGCYLGLEGNCVWLDKLLEIYSR